MNLAEKVFGGNVGAVEKKIWGHIEAQHAGSGDLELDDGQARNCRRIGDDLAACAEFTKLTLVDETFETCFCKGVGALQNGHEVGLPHVAGLNPSNSLLFRLR